MTVPLTTLGYGSDRDAWRVARAAEEIWSTGAYLRSRTTGFPLLEIGVAPAVHSAGWYLANWLPLVFGFRLMLALFRLARRRALVPPVLVVLSLSFLPVMLKNSASTMDYVSALCLMVWAYTAMLEKKWIVTAVLIGLRRRGMFHLRWCVLCADHGVCGW